MSMFSGIRSRASNRKGFFRRAAWRDEREELLKGANDVLATVRAVINLMSNSGLISLTFSMVDRP
jgi:hypothetical protein